MVIETSGSRFQAQPRIQYVFVYIPVSIIRARPQSELTDLTHFPILYQIWENIHSSLMFPSSCYVKVKSKQMNFYSALYTSPLSLKRSDRGSHSFTCHPHTNHTCLYSPVVRRHRFLAGTHCAYLRRDGQAELTWVAGYIPR